jgi:nitrite reductase (NADH) large subunit
MAAARDRRIRATWFSSGRSWPTWVPGRVWDVIRMASVLVSVALAASVALRPEPMLDVVWGMIVPLVPITLLIVPGLWRNVCPLATVSQLPRRLGRRARWVAPSSVMLPAGMLLLLALVTARKVWFNQSGWATAQLIGASALLAGLTGLLFRGKSGWCTGMCPLLPVERLYGQAPSIRLGDTQCGSCVSCTMHCPDRTPGTAAMAELASQTAAGKRQAGLRRLFTAVFPGFVAGYFLIPSVPAVTASRMVLGIVSFSVLSGVTFAFLDHIAPQFRSAIMAGFAALAISLYYGLGTDSFVGAWRRVLGITPFPWIPTVVRVLVCVIALVWWVRAVQLQSVFTRGATQTALGAPYRGRRAAYPRRGYPWHRDRRPRRRHRVGTPVYR